MAHKTPPRPRKHPKQSRSLILVSAIQEACLQILHKEGAALLVSDAFRDELSILLLRYLVDESA